MIATGSSVERSVRSIDLPGEHDATRARARHRTARAVRDMGAAICGGQPSRSFPQRYEPRGGHHYRPTGQSTTQPSPQTRRPLTRPLNATSARRSRGSDPGPPVPRRRQTGLTNATVVEGAVRTLSPRLAQCEPGKDSKLRNQQLRTVTATMCPSCARRLSRSSRAEQTPSKRASNGSSTSATMEPTPVEPTLHSNGGSPTTCCPGCSSPMSGTPCSNSTPRLATGSPRRDQYRSEASNSLGSVRNFV